MGFPLAGATGRRRRHAKEVADRIVDLIGRDYPDLEILRLVTPGAVTIAWDEGPTGQRVAAALNAFYDVDSATDYDCLIGDADGVLVRLRRYVPYGRVVATWIDLLAATGEAQPDTVVKHLDDVPSEVAQVAATLLCDRAEHDANKPVVPYVPARYLVEDFPMEAVIECVKMAEELLA